MSSWMILTLALGWLLPFWLLSLSSRCQAPHFVFWAVLVALTSWPGLLVFVAVYYWWPEIQLVRANGGLPGLDACRRGRAGR